MCITVIPFTQQLWFLFIIVNVKYRKGVKTIFHQLVDETRFDLCIKREKNLPKHLRKNVD